MDADLARKSIQTIGGIALRLPKMTSSLIKQLSTFINMHQDYITNETIVVFRDILRKSKNEYQEIIQVIEQSLEIITEPEAKVIFFSF